MIIYLLQIIPNDLLEMIMTVDSYNRCSQFGAGLLNVARGCVLRNSQMAMNMCELHTSKAIQVSMKHKGIDSEVNGNRDFLQTHTGTGVSMTKVMPELAQSARCRAMLFWCVFSGFHNSLIIL